MLFKGEYSFHGTHADRVRKLTAEFDDSKHKLFSYNYEVYQLAPLVGFLYNRKAELDRTDENPTKIFPGEISKYEDIFRFNYQLIILLDKDYEPDFDNRVDKAFRLYGTEQAKSDEELYESYVRGGIDMLYEKLIEPSTSPDDYSKYLYEFMEEFEGLYGQNTDEIIDLCQIARI